MGKLYLRLLKLNDMNKREKTNIIMWGIFYLALMILVLGYALIGHGIGKQIVAALFSILFSRLMVGIVNAWIFNWAFKKFFDKRFKK